MRCALAIAALAACNRGQPFDEAVTLVCSAVDDSGVAKLDAGVRGKQLASWLADHIRNAEVRHELVELAAGRPGERAGRLAGLAKRAGLATCSGRAVGTLDGAFFDVRLPAASVRCDAAIGIPNVVVHRTAIIAGDTNVLELHEGRVAPADIAAAHIGPVIPKLVLAVDGLGPETAVVAIARDVDAATAVLVVSSVRRAKVARIRLVAEDRCAGSLAHVGGTSVRSIILGEEPLDLVVVVTPTDITLVPLGGDRPKPAADSPGAQLAEQLVGPTSTERGSPIAQRLDPAGLSRELAKLVADHKIRDPAKSLVVVEPHDISTQRLYDVIAAIERNADGNDLLPQVELALPRDK